MSLTMSRECRFEDTTTGHPCENLVEDNHDHCAAGHRCPPVRPLCLEAGETDSPGHFWVARARRARGTDTEI